ncbi:hypothetical protein [Antarctobacter heliothermus]|nr:hypothetical protein [Antarctobacter heliothermus]
MPPQIQGQGAVAGGTVTPHEPKAEVCVHAVDSDCVKGRYS